MVDFRVSRPVVFVARLILVVVGGFALFASYLGFSEPGALPLLGEIVLALFGAAVLGVGLFGPPKWCAAVLWFCQ